MFFFLYFISLQYALSTLYLNSRNGEDNEAEGLCSEGNLKHQLSYGSTDHESYNVDEVRSYKIPLYG